MGPREPLNDKAHADGPTTAADGDAASCLVHRDSPESGADPVMGPSEGRNLPTVTAGTSIGSVETSDSATLILELNPPTAAESSSRRGDRGAVEAKRMSTALPCYDPSSVPT